MNRNGVFPKLDLPGKRIQCIKLAHERENLSRMIRQCMASRPVLTDQFLEIHRSIH